MLPISASNLLTFCSKRFWEVCANASETALSKVTKKCICLIDERMNDSNREHTVCFKIPDTGHYYIGLTAYAFNDYFFDRIGNVADCYNLHSQRLEGPFIFFDSFDSLAALYESDENQDVSAVNEANHNCNDESDQELEQYSRMLLVGDSDDSG